MYSWIDTEKASAAVGKKVVLFGAGKGSEEFIDFIDHAEEATTVLQIVDNDKSLHGKKLLGYRICSPERIKNQNDFITVVTSVSGREPISEQLQAIGLKKDRDFILIGRYPDFAYVSNYETINNHLHSVYGDILHIGPGGFLGLELLLFAKGANRVESIDNYSFGINYPDITPDKKNYAQVANPLQIMYTAAYFGTEICSSL